MKPLVSEAPHAGRRQRAVFVGDLTLDIVVRAGDHVRAGQQRAFTREAVSDRAWLDILNGGTPDDAHTECHAGGSIANVAAAFAIGTRPHSMTFLATTTPASVPKAAPTGQPPWWPGYGVPALDLTRRGIRVAGRDAGRKRPETPTALAVAGSDGTVSALTVRAREGHIAREQPGDLLVIRSDHLRLLSPEYRRSFPRVALLLADDGAGVQDGVDLGKAGQSCLVFGRQELVDSFRGTAGDETAERAVFVAMASTDPVVVTTGAEAYRLPVARAAVTGTDLGAGDAYMGAFLRRMLETRTSVDQAHRAGNEAAAEVLSVVSARVPAPVDLNDVFPPWMGRSSPSSSEGRLSETVHRSPGLSIVTGGQTGVEDFATTRSAEAGLPVHVIMPAGFRQEDKTSPGAYETLRRHVRVHELSSPSFRYRTWATVYAADAVVLVDYAGTEGSAETRVAAMNLNRPVFEAAANFAVGDLEAWLRQWSPESVLIAGNRLSKLGPLGLVEAGAERVNQIVDVIRSEVARRDTLLDVDVASPKPGLADSAQTFAVPENLWRRDTLRRLLADVGLHGTAVHLSARDCATALVAGAVRSAVTWPSLIPTTHRKGVVSIPLGTDAVHYGWVYRQSRSGKPASVAVQYADAFESDVAETERNATRTIQVRHGVEAWVASGFATAGFDTYRTGRSIADADVNDMTFSPVGWETLAVNIAADPSRSAL